MPRTRTVPQIEADLEVLEAHELDPKYSTGARKREEARLNKEMLASLQAQDSERRQAESEIATATQEMERLYSHLVSMTDEFVRAVESLTDYRSRNYALAARAARANDVPFLPCPKFKLQATNGHQPEHDLFPRLRSLIGSDW